MFHAIPSPIKLQNNSSHLPLMSVYYLFNATFEEPLNLIASLSLTCLLIFGNLFNPFDLIEVEADDRDRFEVGGLATQTKNAQKKRPNIENRDE